MFSANTSGVQQEKLESIFLLKDSNLLQSFPSALKPHIPLSFKNKQYLIKEEVLMMHTEYYFQQDPKILENLSFWGFEESKIDSFMKLFYGAELFLSNVDNVDLYIFVSLFQINQIKQQLASKILSNLQNLDAIKLWSFCEEYQDAYLLEVRYWCMQSQNLDKTVYPILKSLGGKTSSLPMNLISESLLDFIIDEGLKDLQNLSTKAVINAIRGYHTKIKVTQEQQINLRIKSYLQSRPEWIKKRDLNDFMLCYPDIYEIVQEQQKKINVLENLSFQNRNEIDELKKLITSKTGYVGQKQTEIIDEKKLSIFDEIEQTDQLQLITSFIEKHKGKESLFTSAKIEDQDDRFLWSLDWHPNSRIFGIGDQKGGLKVYSIDTYQMLVHLPFYHHGVILSLNWSKNGKYIITAGEDKSIKIFNFEQKKIERDLLEYHQNWISVVLWSPLNRYIFSSSEDLTIKFYDFLTNKVVYEILEPRPHVSATSLWSDDERFLVSAERDALLIINFEEKKIEKYLPGFHKARINALSWYENNKYLISLCAADEEDIGIRISEFSNLNVYKEIKGYIFDWIPMCIQKQTRTKYLVYRGKFSNLKFINIEEGQVELEFQDFHEDTIMACMVSPNGKYMVSCSRDKTLRIINFANNA